MVIPLPPSYIRSQQKCSTGSRASRAGSTTPVTPRLFVKGVSTPVAVVRSQAGLLAFTTAPYCGKLINALQRSMNKCHDHDVASFTCPSRMTPLQP